MPGTIPAVGLLIVRSDPGVGTFDFDRQKPGINSEAVTKSVVCYTAVFSVVTQRSCGEERCVTTKKRLCSRLPSPSLEAS